MRFSRLNPPFRATSLAIIAGLIVLSLQALGQAAPGPAASKATLNIVQGPIHALHLSVNLIPLSNAIRPGGSGEVGLYFALDPGWHVYWLNAGDSGEPPQIRWTLPQGITAGAMQFPAPRRLPLGPLMDFGYEGDVLFPIPLQASAGLKAPKTQRLLAHVDWLVCREVCIPGKADLMLPLEVSRTPAAPDAATLALFNRFRAMMPQPLPPAARASFATTSAGFTLALTGLSMGPASPHSASAEFFPSAQNQVDNAAPQPVYLLRDGVELSIKKDENLSGKPALLSGVLRLPDGNAYEIHASPGPVPAVADQSGTILPSPGELKNILRIAALAFVGGMILNLMPCVLPVLFLKGLSLVESSHEQRGRQRAHGAVYALGILVSFWVVAGILLVLRAGGRQLGWGFQFQSPSFVAVIAMLLFFLGLSLAGMFDIGLTATSAGSGLAAKRGYAGSFFTGVLAMVVATPCTAPFMGAAIGFALSQSALTSLAIFTALALGLAAPYVLLTLNPSWTRLIPRPGAWMEILKQFTAVPIFATVIWLVWLFAQGGGVNALAGLLTAFLFLAVAGWILGRWPARRVPAFVALAVILLAAAAPLYALRLFSAPDQAAEANGPVNRRGSALDVWTPFSAAALEQYRSAGRPVFVDFTAAWCLSCQVNERVVLDRPEVQRRLRDSGVVLMRADWTRHDEQIGQALSDLGRSGVPAYALYVPGRSPQVLPEVLTPGIVIGALNSLQAKLEQQSPELR